MTEVTSTSSGPAAAETASSIAAVATAATPLPAPVAAELFAMATAAIAATPSVPTAKAEVPARGPAAIALAAIESSAAVEAAAAKKSAAEAKKDSEASDETSMSDAEVAPEVELATLGEAGAAVAGQAGLPCGVLPVVDAPVAVAPPVVVPVGDAGFALSPALLGLLGLGALGLGYLLLRDDDDDDDEAPIDENDPPVAADEAIAVNEDDAAVTGELDATDPDGDDLTYELDTDVAGLILNEDGSYTFDPAAADLDHLCEGDTQTITADYTVTDEDGATDVGTITITVTGVNDLPVVTSGATGTVAENAATTTVVYAATVTDADGDEPVTFSLAGADAALFTIDPATGEVRLVNSADFEEDAQYNITIVATDDCGATDTQDVVVNVTDVNEVPDQNVVLLDDEDDDGNPNTAAEFDASGGAFIIGDDADQPSTTIITGFGDDDILVFEEGAEVFFSSSADDPNDLEITVNEGGIVSQVILDDVLSDADFVFNEETAEDALGFEFFEQAPVGTDFADTNFA